MGAQKSRRHDVRQRVFAAPELGLGDVDPKTVSRHQGDYGEEQYRQLMVHEENHRKQYQVAGERMMPLYVLAEGVSALNSPGGVPGCANYFEITADLHKGGYC